MSILKTKRIFSSVALLLGVMAANFAFSQTARASGDIQSPALPGACAGIAVEAGHVPVLRTYAIGVQIYRWDGSAWTFFAPEANLYADAGYKGKIGIHYGGPRWESNSGSQVLAGRVPGTGCTPDSSAIPWLLLKTVSTDGPGVFGKVTYIQRVNTAGGIAPSTDGTYVGEEKRVPYTAEYYFYRATAE